MRWRREEVVMAWRAVRAAAFDPEWLRDLVTHNVALKLLSLLIAFGLWSFVNFGERDTEESLKVPLELRNIPAHLMITSPRVDFIDVRVNGPRTLLGRIDRKRLSISLDLNGIRPGPSVFRVEPEALNLPHGVKVARINPAQLTLELERVGHKAVPVRIRFAGKPPPDLQLGDTKVSPETVQVTGPASDVEDVQAATTEPLDISTATVGTLERELTLESAGEYLSFSANRVAAQVHFEEIFAVREFKHVPVEVRSATSAVHLSPDSVRISVRGPKRLVAGLELPAGAVYIDAQGLSAGEHVVQPSAELPPGVEILSFDPARVTLSVHPRKRLARRRPPSPSR